MSVSDWFSTFCDNIQVKNTESIALRYRRITRRLNLDFWGTDSEVSHSLYVGSYGRNTAISGLSDLDMLFELQNSTYHRYNGHAGNGQSALLQAVRASLQKTYPSSRIGGDGQVVQIVFDDGITFEVLPAFLNQDQITYTYPDSNNSGSWKQTDPRREMDAIRIRNNECNRNLVRLCRMMRSWKNIWTVPIRSMLIDTLAYQFIANWSERDKSFLYYDWMSRDFFLFMANQDLDKEYWSAPGSGHRVYGKGSFQHKARRCYNLALEAIEHERGSYHYSAKAKWREIFGTATFPI